MSSGSSPGFYAWTWNPYRGTATSTANPQSGTTTYVYNALGQLAAEYAGRTPAGLRYLTADPLGSARVVTGQDRSVLTRHDYLPFGQEIEPARGNRATVSGYTASLIDGPAQKFTGKERGAESRLDYFNARYFSGAGGRFSSADAPFADQYKSDSQSWNLYVYSRNNPLRFGDLDGRKCVTLDDGSNQQHRLYHFDKSRPWPAGQIIRGRNCRSLLKTNHKNTRTDGHFLRRRRHGMKPPGARTSRPHTSWPSLGPLFHPGRPATAPGL